MASPRQPLPEFKTDQVDIRQLREFRRVLELRLQALEKPAQVGYTISNGVTSRTLDVSSATLDEVREFLGTLVTDLKNAGKLG